MLMRVLRRYYFSNSRTREFGQVQGFILTNFIHFYYLYNYVVLFSFEDCQRRITSIICIASYVNIFSEDFFLLHVPCRIIHHSRPTVAILYRFGAGKTYAPCKFIMKMLLNCILSN